MTSPQKAPAAAPEADNEDGELYDAAKSLAHISATSPRHDQDGILIEAPVKKMGNANSTPEEISAGLHATAQAIRNGGSVQTTTTRSKTSSTAQRQSTGKLKQPSKSPRHNNPAYRNPLAAASAQRALPARSRKNGSAFDLPGDSPVKDQFEVAKPQFSPLKKQKRGARRAREVDAEDAVEGDEADDDGNELRYRDFFTDAEARRHERGSEDAAAGANEDDHGTIEVAAKKTQVASGSEAPVTPKRGRGRPPKNSIATAPSPKVAKKAERPKVSPDVSTATRPEQAQNVTASATEPGDAPRQTRSKNTTVQEKPAISRSTRSRAKQRISQASANKRAGASSLDDLRRRRSSQADVDAEFPPDEDEAGEQAHDEEDEEVQDGDPILAPDDDEEQPAVPQVDHVRLSQVLFDVPAQDDERGTQPTSGPVRGTKRKAASQPAKANTKQKRAGFGQSTHSDEADIEDGSDQTRLFGQWRAFVEVIKKANNIGRSVQDGLPGDRNDVRLTDAEVEATVCLCNKAIKLYNDLKSRDGPTVSERDPANLLNDISERVDRLRGFDDDQPTDFDNDTRATEIYFHLMRKLVDLTKATILCYEALDTGGAAGGQITFGHARTIVTLLQVILDLAKSSEDYSRPPSHLHVVQPVREFIPILRRISQVLSSQIHADAQSQRQARQRERDRLYRDAEAEEERRRKQQEATARKWRHKWQNLHTERMLVEGGLMPAIKRKHLQIQDRYYYTEYDQNGEPFQREEIFAFRKGPLPVFIEAAQKVEWKMVELSTLCDGLKDYTGEHVFERIFRKYCGRGRDLNRFNVTEIVVTAAAVKEKLVEDRRKNYNGDTEQWILEIPVWTSAHHGEGQENVNEEEVEEIDVTMSGALPDEVEVGEVEV